MTPLAQSDISFKDQRIITAYVIVDINVTDPIRYEDYKKLAAPTVEIYGGKYIARGGKPKPSKAIGHPHAWSY